MTEIVTSYPELARPEEFTQQGLGWVPWLLDAMDEAYKKHHFWVRPKLKHLPSDYFRAHGFASFQEDKAGDWLVHCHFPNHMEGGMMTRYLVTP